MPIIEEGANTAKVAAHWLKLRPDIDPTTFSIMLRITQMGLLATRQADRIASRHGINDADARLMMAIRSNISGKPIRPSELSERMDLKRATITYRMDRLLEKGLAQRSFDATDGRALNVRLTRKGEEVIDAVMTEINTNSQKRLTAVDGLPGGRAAFNDFLVALVAAWDLPAD